MSNATDPSNFCFEFSISRDEDRFFRTLVIERIKAHIDWRGVWIIILIAYAVVVVVGCVGMNQGWLTSNTIYASSACFVVGQLYALSLATWSMRRISDKLFELDRIAQTWRVAFDDASIIVKTPNIESRMSWNAMTDVADTQVMVVMWCDTKQGLFIPARVFASSTARTAFAEWASERLRSAQAASNVIRSASRDSSLIGS